MKIVQYSDKYLEMFHDIQDEEFVCDSCECIIKPELGDKLNIQSKTILEIEGSEYLDNMTFYEDLDFRKFPEGYFIEEDEYKYAFDTSDEFLSDQVKIEDNISAKYRVVCPFGRIIKKTIEFLCPVCGNNVTNEWFEIPECTGLINVQSDEGGDMCIDKLYSKQYTTKDGDEFTFDIGIGGDGFGECDEDIIKFLESIGFKENDENRMSVYMNINSYD